MLCPHCETNQVPTVSWQFTDTHVRVAVCDSCALWEGETRRVAVRDLAELYVPETTWRHRDGLVEFAS